MLVRLLVLLLVVLLLFTLLFVLLCLLFRYSLERRGRTRLRPFHGWPTQIGGASCTTPRSC